jgi:protein-S-isoprenylcysteine O-methyltransferase Ste14
MQLNNLLAAPARFVPTLAQIIYVVFLGMPFLYFFGAGGRTFKHTPLSVGSVVAQISFLITGNVATWWIGWYWPVHVYNAIVAGVLVTCSLALYEWARRTVWAQGLYIAWSDAVPDHVIESGPYAYLRHPIYASYVLAFLGLLIAIPTRPTLTVFVFNVLLYYHAAVTDERSLGRSPLAAEYSEYVRRTGRFVPSRRSGRGKRFT